MQKHGTIRFNALLALSLVSAGFLVFIMFLTPVFKQQIFFEREILSPGELFILVGFGLNIYRKKNK